MTSNLINRLCLFSPALLTVTRDEQQNKQTGYSKSAVEVGCIRKIHNLRFNRGVGREAHCHSETPHFPLCP